MSESNAMNQNLTTRSGGFPSLFHIANANQTLPMPFAREILLLECHIAGTNFRPAIAEIESLLTTGAKLILRRQPDNKFDENAIAIYDNAENHLGYVPKTQNIILARLLDAGKPLSAKLTAKERVESWLKLDIEIYLVD